MVKRAALLSFPVVIIFFLLAIGCTVGPPSLMPSPTVIPTLSPTQTARPSTPSSTPTPNPSPTPRPTPTPLYWDTRHSTPEDVGMDSEMLLQAIDTIESEDLAVHSLLVIRSGRMAMEAYFPPYNHRVRHDTYSCTKSFTSALIGIALREGYIESLDQRALDFLPDTDLPEDDPRYAITIEDLLTMRCGLYWPESSIPYSSGQNVLMQMFWSSDWVQFILDQPMATTPGSVFNYNSGCSHLLAVVLREATGMTPLSFARQYLFAPLGITAVSWTTDGAGTNFGGGGLWLRPRDMAKFGQLYLQGGVWDDQQILPADWVEASVSGPAYGYQWWRLAGGAYAALGYRGQRIVVYPDLDMVVVVTADQASSISQYLIDTFIVPAVRSSE